MFKKMLKRSLLFFVKYLLSRTLIIGFLLFLSYQVLTIGMGFVHFLRTPMNLQEKQTIEVSSGMTIDSLAAELHQKKLMAKPDYFKWYAKVTGKAGLLKVGEYPIDRNTTPTSFLNMIVEGRQGIQYQFTIIEGWTFKQLRQFLAESPHVKQTLPLSLTNEEVMAKLGLQDKPFEGYFLPETYFFPKNYTDVDLLKRSYNDMQGIISKVWDQRTFDLPYKNMHELVTMASIIEKETGASHERPEISGVFVRRLQKGMRLQTDPTVIYGLGDNYRGTIYRSDLKKETPFNTYIIDGLPPTPIAMPSIDALRAAANPKEGKSLYFVAKGDGSGEHVFSETLDQHNKAVREYRKRIGQ